MVKTMKQNLEKLELETKYLKNKIKDNFSEILKKQRYSCILLCKMEINIY